MKTRYLIEDSLIYQKKPEVIQRPGKPIEVDYAMRLDNVGRIYTLYIGTFSEFE